MRVTENSVIHVDRSEKSVIHIDLGRSTYVADGILKLRFQRPHVVLLHHIFFLKITLDLKLTTADKLLNPNPHGYEIKNAFFLSSIISA
jgi:hypothetical protein